MRTEFCGEVVLRDFEPTPDNLEAEFLAGLKHDPKFLPCKFFYDERGSRLFDQICELQEYYVTRTETQILRKHLDEIAGLCGPHCLLVELGSGSSTKTRMLLDTLESPVAYVPIDISRPHLLRATHALNGSYPGLEILPVCADYNRTLSLPVPTAKAQRTILFFPGSTIGNFEPCAAADFLARIGTWCRPGDGLIIGVDWQKSQAILEAAYNDSKGVTAAFNLNLLRRAKRELGADFNLNMFFHRAIYNEVQGRIEMYLVSRCRQTVTLAREKIQFEKGEQITTEYSYKYRDETFRAIASAMDWKVECTWTDKNRWFGVYCLCFEPQKTARTENF